MTDPMANARRRPIIVPSLPPVTINMAMTSVYSVIAVCTPVTSVPRSLATVAMETFMTELSRVMRNWPDARVSRTRPLPVCAATAVDRAVIAASSRRQGSHTVRPAPAPRIVRAGRDRRRAADLPS